MLVAPHSGPLPEREGELSSGWGGIEGRWKTLEPAEQSPSPPARGPGGGGYRPTKTRVAPSFEGNCSLYSQLRMLSLLTPALLGMVLSAFPSGPKVQIITWPGTSRPPGG